MSSLQSLREFISERLAAAAEEIFRHCEGTIVQYEQELCRQRRLLDVVWKPQLQLHAIVLPEHYVSEKEDLGNQQKNSRVKQKEPKPPQIKEEQGELEPSQTEEECGDLDFPQMKEEQEWLCISQDKNQVELKQETNTLLEYSTYMENEHNVVNLNNQQSFNGSDGQDEDGNQHVSKKSNTTNFVKKCNETSKEKRLSYKKSHKSSRIVSNLCVYRRTESGERSYVCKECGKHCSYWSRFRLHMRTHTGERPFTCKVCDTRFSQISSLKRHMMLHTGQKPFSCKECDQSLSRLSDLKRHMMIHTGEKPFSCKECTKSFRRLYHLKKHMRTHINEDFFF